MIGTYTLRNTTYKPKERNVLDLFTVEGEGGYKANQYTFMFKSSCFFNDNILSDVKAVMQDDSKLQKITFGKQTFNYRDGILRIVLGNNNRCIMYRDGSVDIGGKNFQFPELATYIPKIRDTFCPSTYSTGNDAYQQMFLLENGDLIIVNLAKKQITTLLTGVQKFINKNQAHNCEAIVGLKNGDMYQVWIKSPGNKTNTGTQIIQKNGVNINHNDVLFCTVGDHFEHRTICFKSEPNKLYNFIKTNFIIQGCEANPIKILEGGEYFVGGMANEYDIMILTNKKIISNFSKEQLIYPPNPTASNPTIKAKNIVTPTAYSMIIEDSDGKYWYSERGKLPPIPYTFFDTLKVNLDPIKESML